MYITKYTSYFHDGVIHDILHIGNDILIFMESAELRPEWNKDNILLSKRNTISGKLHLEKIIGININEEPFFDKLIKTYDDGNIYHFEINDSIFKLEVSWENYSPKPKEETDVFMIQIEAEKIYWENIPTLFDDYWDSPV